MYITITGKNNKNQDIKLTMPVNPEKIDYSSEGKFQEYQIINKGTAKVPNGIEITTISWEAFFPGKILEKFPFIIKYTDPTELHNTMQYWRANGIKLRLTITESPFQQMYVYIEKYDAHVTGSDGSIYYTLTFSHVVDVSISTVPKKRGQTSGNTRTSKNTGAKKYTTKNGDTLWTISKRFYKTTKQWKKIYNANKSTIEARAKKEGYKSSNKGKILPAGTKLKIPA